MSDAALVAIITGIASAVPPTILALAAWKAAKATGLKVDAQGVEVEKIHKATNSMKDQLVAAVKLSSHAEGMQDEKNRANEASSARP